MWLQGFEAWSIQHAVTALLCVLAIAVVCLLGNRWRVRRPSWEHALRTAWVILLIAVNGYAQHWYCTPAHYRPDYSLPLHICDLATWARPARPAAENAMARDDCLFLGSRAVFAGLRLSTLHGGLRTSPILAVLDRSHTRSSARAPMSSPRWATGRRSLTSRSPPGPSCCTTPSSFRSMLFWAGTTGTSGPKPPWSAGSAPGPGE